MSTSTHNVVPKCQVQVLYAYAAAERNQLSLKPDEIINVLEEDESGWWIGQKINGDVGIFPSNYVRVIKDSAPVITMTPRTHAAFTNLDRSYSFNKPKQFNPQLAVSLDPKTKQKSMMNELGLDESEVLGDLSQSDSDEEEDGKSKDPSGVPPQQQFEGLKKQLAAAVSEKELAITAKHHAEEQLKRTQADSERYKRSLAIFQTNNATLKKEKQDLMEELALLHQHAAGSDVAPELQSVNARLSEDRKNLTKQVQSLEQELEKTRTKLTDLEARSGMVAQTPRGGDVSARGTSASVSLAEFQQIRLAFARAEDEKHDLQDQLNETKEALESALKKASAAPAAAAGVSDGISKDVHAHLQKEKDALATQVDKLTAAVQSAENNKIALDQQVADLTRQIADLKKQIEAAKASGSSETQQLLGEVEAAQAETEAVRKELQAARSQLSSSEQSSAAAAQQLQKRLEDTLHELEAAKAAAVQQSNASAKEIQAVRAELARAQRQIEELKQSLANSTSTMGSQLAAAHKEAASLRASQQQLRALAAELKATMRAELQAASRGMAELSTQSQDLLTRYKKELRERRKLFNQIQELKGNIRVYCRARPALEREGASCVTVTDEASLDIFDTTHAKTQHFEFDRVFGGDTAQETVFEDVKPLATSVLDGYRVCIFAYGQTGSGKTYTMEGTPSDRGINYRVLAELFSMQVERAAEWSYTIFVSVIEIYNESVFDLLSKSKNPRDNKLDIRQGPNGNYVPDLTQVPVRTVEDVIETLQQGYKNRSVGATNANEHSSRSHCVLCVNVEGTNLLSGTKFSGRLNLVDLAGSERLKKTEATGERLTEAQNINKSLSSLGDVIAALATKQKHIPYRNSKLTYFLQDSLGGDSKTLMFVNVSPAAENVGETICSLNFAQRVRTVELGEAKQHRSSVAASPRV